MAEYNRLHHIIASIASRSKIQILGLWIIVSIVFILVFFKISYAGICDCGDCGCSCYQDFLGYRLMYDRGGGQIIKWHINSSPLTIKYMVDYLSTPTSPLTDDSVRKVVQNAFETWQNEFEGNVIFSEKNYQKSLENDPDNPGYITIKYAN